MQPDRAGSEVDRARSDLVWTQIEFDQIWSRYELNLSRTGADAV